VLYTPKIGDGHRVPMDARQHSLADAYKGDILVFGKHYSKEETKKKELVKCKTIILCANIFSESCGKAG